MVFQLILSVGVRANVGGLSYWIPGNPEIPQYWGISYCFPELPNILNCSGF